MNQSDQLKFLQYIEERRVTSTDIVDLERDTLEEAKAKVDGLSAGADHFQELVRKQYPNFGR